jgi:hypothetical protein
MGMYTELNCAVRLKKDTPTPVIAVLLICWITESLRPSPLPAHPLFNTNCWRFILTGSSYYFACCEAQSAVWPDEITNQYCVSVRANLKNYDGEIEKFIDWITPHIDAMEGDFVGYSRYEETEVPTLLYYPNRSFTPSLPSEITA